MAEKEEIKEKAWKELGVEEDWTHPAIDYSFDICIEQAREEVLTKVEARLVMPWEGYLESTTLNAKEMHRKITDVLREQFNLIKREELIENKKRVKK